MRARGTIVARNMCCHCLREDEGIRSCEDTRDDVLACHSGFYYGAKSRMFLEEYRRGISF